MVRLSGPQYQALSEALRDAFPRPRLEQLLLFRLEKRLDDIVPPGDYQSVVFKLIEAAEAEGWTADLVRAARASNPGNPRLLAVATELGPQLALAPGATPSQDELERLIVAANSFLDVEAWRTRLGELEARVCRVEVPTDRGEARGTGFLVAPDLVCTNHHVVDAVIEGEQGRANAQGQRARATDVVLRFDFKRRADGAALHPGEVVRLATGGWLVDASPPSAVDHAPDPKPGLPSADELDYALLRVAGAPGERPIGGPKTEPGAPPRGWIVPRPEPFAFEAKPALFIVQHPLGEPLKLALDTQAVLGVNANRTRVRYRTNTEPGSSGSPCFNSDWELVALHHSGDRSLVPAYNEGIPFEAILARLARQAVRLPGPADTR